MNYKAFLTGLAIGFVVAISPACGGDDGGDGDGDKTCSASNCNGCCDGDTCVTSTSAAKCGNAGNACVACTGNQVCTNGQCTTPGGNNDGGPTGNCASTCAGCCTSTGTCLAGTSNANCGKNGATCSACTGTDTCNAQQACATEPVVTADAGLIGGPCTTDAECQADPGLGANGICKKVTSDGGVYGGGYCTKVCTGPGSCPAGSDCLQLSVGQTALYGETDAICMKDCTDDNDCRTPQYTCYYDNDDPAQRTFSQCWIDPPAPQGKIGSDCADSNACVFPPTWGGCFAATNSQGQPSGWVNGYCTAYCYDKDYCGKNPAGGDNVCFRQNPQNATGLCLRGCNNPGAVQGSAPCSTGEVCDVVSATETACLPACNTNAECGTNAQCDGGYCF